MLSLVEVPVLSLVVAPKGVSTVQHLQFWACHINPVLNPLLIDKTFQLYNILIYQKVLDLSIILSLLALWNKNAPGNLKYFQYINIDQEIVHEKTTDSLYGQIPHSSGPFSLSHLLRL